MADVVVVVVVHKNLFSLVNNEEISRGQEKRIPFNNQMNSVKLLTIQIYNNLLLCVLELYTKVLNALWLAFLWNFSSSRERERKRAIARGRNERETAI